MAIWKQEAPAKVNLTLDILGRRPDGYHEMRMVMQAVSLADTVSIQETEGEFILHGIKPLEGKKSLEQQAAEAFFRAIGLPMPGLEVSIEKRSPAYAGLGGGSADVAALLRLLREAYAPEMPPEALEAVGLEVGCDVPFCLRGGTALAEGRGELLTDLPPLPDCCILLCKPDFGLPTPEMFARVPAGPQNRPPDTGSMLSALEAGDLAGIAARLGNVFEAALPPEARREIDHIKSAMLDGGALNAAMSGSGPTVFGLFPPEAETSGVLEALGQRYSQVFQAAPVRRLL